MSTFPPSNQINTGLAATGQFAVGKAVPTQTNPGTPVVIHAMTPAQLTLSTATGKVTIPTSKPVNNIQVGKEFVAKINQQNQNTILDITAKFSQRQVTLTPAQSQQVFASISQTPSNIATDNIITGKVISHKGNQVEIAVNNQRITIPVSTAKEFVQGQTITVKLSGSNNQWQLSAEQGVTRSQQPVSNQVAAKLLDGITKAGQKLASSSENGLLAATQQTVKKDTAGTISKVLLSQTPAGEVKLNLQFSKEPVAQIKVSNEVASKLVQSGIQSNSNFKIEQAQPQQVGKHVTNTPLPEANAVPVYNNPSVKGGLSGGSTAKPDSKFVDAVIQQAQKGNPQNKSEAPQNLKNVTTADSRDIPGKINSQESSVKPNTGAINSNAAVESSKLNSRTSQVPLEISLGKLNKATASLQTGIDQTSRHMRTSAAQTSEHIKASIEKTATNEINSSSERLLKRFNIGLDSQSNQVIGKVLSRINEVMANQNRPAISENQLANLVKQLVSMQPLATSKQTYTDLNARLNEIIQQATSPELKSQLTDIKSNIVPEVAKVANIQAEQIKQLLQAPTLPLNNSSIQTVSPPTNNSFVAGLVSLLQLSLGSRLSQQQPKLLEQTAQALTSLLAGTGNISNRSASSSKNLKEFNGLEQKKQILKLASDLLANHSQQKLNNAEKLTQGQEVFHYILPYGQGQQEKPFELLIQREPDREKMAENNHAKQSIWSLTMKLSVGEVGEALTKAKINGSQVDIDFFTSSSKLKELIFNFFPFFKKRLDALGMNTQLGRCEQGDIPDSLKTRPYQLLETKV